MDPYQRGFFKLASKVTWPTIFSVVGFAYIAIPPHVQELVRHFLPSGARERMLGLFDADEWLIALLSFSILFAIWGGLGNQITVRFVKKKYKEVIEKHKEVTEEYDLLKLDHESKSINCYKLFTNYLFGYCRRFNLTPDERVSLYKLDMNMFSCIGRHSDNEIFKSKPDRLYPQDEGCISVAWEVGAVRDLGAPDPTVDLDEWIEYNIEKFNLSSDTLRNMSMKSRSHYGFRLRGRQNETIAVVMFESLNPGGLKYVTLDRFFTEDEKRNITSLVEALESHIPSLEVAKSEGF